MRRQSTSATIPSRTIPAMPAHSKIPAASLGKVLILALGFTPLALAQTDADTPAAPAAPAAETKPGPPPVNEVARFGAFLDQHPAIEARLRENAALLDDPVFLKNHPQLATYLASHPNVKAELAKRPRWFLPRELSRPTPAPAPANPRQVAELDKFLDQHPDIARQLAQRPQLLRQPQFLNSHPVLREYVNQHPEIVRPAAPKAANPKAPPAKAAAPKPNLPAKAGPRTADEKSAP
jgi:hypothetical protein